LAYQIGHRTAKRFNAQLVRRLLIVEADADTAVDLGWRLDKSANPDLYFVRPSGAVRSGLIASRRPLRIVLLDR
jgi:hypothetical protein